MIQKERIQLLNRKSILRGKYVIYWMQASQREECSHALEYAVRQANILDKPLIVFFGLTEKYPSAYERHYAFMLEGLHETAEALRRRGIKMVIRLGAPETTVTVLAKEAFLVVVDCGYTRIQKQWREQAAKAIDCSLVQVETDVIAPVEEVSYKEEYAAATIRNKINRMLADYLIPLRKQAIKHDSLGPKIESFDITDIDRALKHLHLDRTVPTVRSLKGGTSGAELLLERFLRHKLKDYADMRNDPTADSTSGLSPYLHFGQISPLHIALKVGRRKGAEEFLEELIIRRELSMNFVNYNRPYDSMDALPRWCLATLKKHERDRREYLYSPEQLERAETHDPYWNASQKEMVHLGKMSGYMRMYWGKKILEWSENPREAYKVALYLNDKYELDGRDPNGYAGVAWCFGKHDRPWKERPIFGMVRYMNAAGLQRKFDADKYVKMIDQQCRQV
jgi:deoxyribodipyrimidine photo-lyase